MEEENIAATAASSGSLLEDMDFNSKDTKIQSSFFLAYIIFSCYFNSVHG